MAVALSDGWLSLDHFAAKFIHGRQLLSAEAVRLTTADAGTPGPCGIGWWNNGEGDCAKLPRDAFFGSGAGPKFKT
ncbi:MAG TPA: hypothetical protein P5055_06040 [Candidatus Paceibacterota bacterium]|nr:hypothetical protein [Candidatus Paceibacterota bacterium]